jgi:hypothetical protein
VEDILTKRPFTKHLTFLLLEGAIKSPELVDRLAHECLKQLTSEDLWSLYLHDQLIMHQDHMSDFETQYLSEVPAANQI